MSHNLSHKRVRIVGAPMDLGQQRRGVDMGPSALRYAGLQAHLLMEILAESGKVCSADVVEVNPILDAGNRTAEVAVELMASLLGQQIL